jgi:hypothetical protein
MLNFKKIVRDHETIQQSADTRLKLYLRLIDERDKRDRMTDFKKLRAYLNRIAEVAEEDSNSVISLGIIPAVREAIQELDRLEQERDREARRSKRRSRHVHDSCTNPD